MGLGLFVCLPYLVEPLRGDTQAELSPGVEVVAVSTQSRPSWMCLVCLESLQRARAEDS